MVGAVEAGLFVTLYAGVTEEVIDRRVALGFDSAEAVGGQVVLQRARAAAIGRSKLTGPRGVFSVVSQLGEVNRRHSATDVVREAVAGDAGASVTVIERRDPIEVIARARAGDDFLSFGQIGKSTE